MAAHKMNLFYFKLISELSDALRDISAEYDDIGSRVDNILAGRVVLEDRLDYFIAEDYDYSDEILPIVIVN